MARIGKNQLISLQKKYKTDEAIAKLYGLSRQAIHQLRKKYSIDTIPDKHNERNSQILTLYNNGVSVIKLSKKYSLSITHVYRIIKSSL
jgi:hypothetical protein